MKSGTIVPSASESLWERWHVKALFTPKVALQLCLAGGLLLPSNAAWAMLCYVLVLPTVLLKGWRGWRPGWAPAAFTAMLALCVWSSLSIMWDDNLSGHGNGYGYWLLNAACMFGFLFCFKMAEAEDARLRERAISVLIAAGALNALISLGIVVAMGDWGIRLTGWGATRNPVLGAAILDICLLLAIGRVAEGGRWRHWHLAAMLPMGLYLLLSYSRTPLLAMACALAILAFGSWRAFGRAVLAGGGVLLAGVALWWLRPGWLAVFTHNLLARGTDCHVTIWLTAWREFLSRPLIGHGPSARLPIEPHGFCPAYPSPHDLYLSLLLYSGLIGFVLFAVSELLVLRHLWRCASGFGFRLWLAVMTVPLVVGLTDLSQVIKGPSPMWYIIWMPLLLVLLLRPAGSAER
ncbi:O-antigen ligase family protein [Acidocella sp.]|uniref:O-antigen ligase family protein n=1 Tax=Acidocella sp. TaxID=50710 RepID=UPI003D08220D